MRYFIFKLVNALCDLPFLFAFRSSSISPKQAVWANILGPI
jgi:hypothetical protein